MPEVTIPHTLKSGCSDTLFVDLDRDPSVASLLTTLGERRSQNTAQPQTPTTDAERKNKGMHELVSKFSQQRSLGRTADTLATVETIERLKLVERQMARPWKKGDVYSPHDLTPVEMKKWRRKNALPKDAFDATAINPIDEWKVGRYPVLSAAMRGINWCPEPVDTVGVHDYDGANKAS